MLSLSKNSFSLNHFTIRTKFKLYAAISLISIISILSLNYYKEITQKQYNAAIIEISNIQTDMLMLRRHEKDFLARNDLKYVKKFDSIFNKLKTEIGKLENELLAVGINSAQAITLLENFSIYNESFHKVVTSQKKIGLHSKDGLYGSLRDAVHQAESYIKALNDQMLRANMLQLRRNEKDFMLRLNLKYLEKFNKNITVFNQSLSGTDYDTATKEQISTAMQAYKERFTALVNLSQTKGLNSKSGFLGAMRATVHKTEKHLNELYKTLNNEIDSATGNLTSMVLLVSTILGGIIIALTFWLSMTILRPIQALSSTMRQVTEDCDLNLRIDADSYDEIGQTGLAFNSMLDSFVKIVSQVRDSATQMGSAAEKLAIITDETSQGISNQTSQTDQVATAINEMAATVQEVARNANEAASVANDTSQQAHQGRSVVNTGIDSIEHLANELDQASKVINKLEEDGTKIGAILDVIRGIAEQTNLLALNAAIEAARAGEQGRGFAVVADEVRTLASRTQESTQEIQQMIESLQAGTVDAVQAMEASRERAQQGVEKISAAGDALGNIADGILRINEMNTLIASAAVQQGSVSEEINKNVIEITHIAEASNTNSQETHASSEELAHLSVGLQELVSRFKAS